MPLSFIELFLGLLAARAFPVIGKILKRDAVMLNRIVYIAADRTNIFPACLFFGEVDLSKHGRNGIVQIHDALCLQVFISLGRMRSAIDRRVIPDKLAHPIQRLTGSGEIIENRGQLVFIKRLVHIGDIPMDYIKQAAILYDYNAVTIGMTKSSPE